MAWLLLFSSAWVIWLSWTGISLYNNYQIARQSGLRLVVSPLTPLNPAWLLLQKRLRPWINSLPWGLGGFAKYSYMGWQFDDKYAVHQKLGGAFILVTPSVNELILADPEAITQVQARRKDFVKPPLMYGMSHCKRLRPAASL